MTGPLLSARTQGRLRLAGTLLFILALAYLVLGPILRLQLLAFSENASGFRAAFGVHGIGATILNTISLAIGSLVIGLVCGTVLAWWALQLPERLRFLRVLPVLPIVVPAVANVSGWAFLLSPRPGYLNALLRLLPWWSHLDSGPVEIYSITWIVIITGFSLSAFVYLFVSAGLKNINSEMIEAARVAGSSATGVFFKVTLPLLRPALLYGGGVALLLGLGQFTAPLLLGTNKGVRVITTEIYQLLAQTTAEFPAAAAIGTPLLVFGVTLVLLQKLLLGNQARFVTHGGRAFRALGRPSMLAALGIFLFSFITTVLPIIALIILALSPFWSPRIRLANLTFDNFRQIFAESSIVEAIFTSLSVSIAAVAICLVIGFAVASILIRGRQNVVIKSILDIIVAMPLGVPAVIFGAGFLYAYTRPPLILYGTPWVLVVVYVTLMLPFTTRMQLAAMMQLGQAYVEAARVSGAGALRTSLSITLPLMRQSLGGAAALMFVLLTHEFTASVLVRSPGNQVMGTVLFEYWINGGYPLVAAIALVMTAVTAAGVAAANLLGGGDTLNKL